MIWWRFGPLGCFNGPSSLEMFQNQFFGELYVEKNLGDTAFHTLIFLF